MACKLRKGLSGIGVPDLMVAQNAKQHLCEIFSFDNHYSAYERYYWDRNYGVIGDAHVLMLYWEDRI
jgi:hypothetical protein